MSKTVEELIRVLEIARDRAIDLGNEVQQRGGTDNNRGQFLRLVEDTIENAKRELDVQSARLL